MLFRSILVGRCIFGNIQKFGGTGRHLDHRRIDLRHAFDGQQNRMKSKNLRTAQNPADIVGIFHIVEEQDSRPVPERFRGLARIGFDFQDSTLMIPAARQIIEPPFVYPLDGNVHPFQIAGELFNPRLVGGGLVQIRFIDRAPARANHLESRIDPVNIFPTRFCHDLILPCHINKNVK